MSSSLWDHQKRSVLNGRKFSSESSENIKHNEERKKNNERNSCKMRDTYYQESRIHKTTLFSSYYSAAQQRNYCGSVGRVK